MEYEEYSNDEMDHLRRQATAALGRIIKGKNWEDWKLIGAYIDTGRKWAMHMSNSNQPVGIRYNNALNVWFSNNPKFRDGIGKDERNDLMRCIEHPDEITAFLKSQDKTRTRQLIHPTSVWRAYKRHEADREKAEAAAKADAAAAEAVKGDDGTPLNVAIRATPTLLAQSDVDAWGIAVQLRKTHGDKMCEHIARSLFKLLKLMGPVSS